MDKNSNTSVLTEKKIKTTAEEKTAQGDNLKSSPDTDADTALEVSDPANTESETIDVTKLDNVDLLEVGAKKIYLIGTAHVSKTSKDLVEQVIAAIKPDTVAVELCDGRYQSMTQKERWKNLDLFTVIKEGKALILLAQLVLAGFQKKIAKDLDIEPGAEMKAAISAANEIGADLVMADREVKITLKRTWAALNIWQKAKVVSAMIGSVFVKNNEVTAEEIERLKSSDALEEAMKEFAEKFPAVRKSLIDERDQYLAEKIKLSPGETIVAVVGAGHVPGIKQYIDQKIDLQKLNVIPRASKVKKIIPWLIPFVVIAIITYGFFRGDARSGEMVYYWVIVNAIAGGIGALIVKGHPVTVLVATAVSPFTSLNPAIAAGWVAGITEALIRKPKVSDLETITEDIGSFRTMVDNQAIRVLLVIVSTNLFGSIGTLVGISGISRLLK